MTVSRVINNSGYISQDARERVEAAVAEIGYVPNTLARSLRFKQTKTLALVLTDITNPFFTTLARGAEDVASEQGFNVIFCNTDESESEQARELTALVQKRVDGVLLVPAASSAEAVAFLREQGVPVVVLVEVRLEHDLAAVDRDQPLPLQVLEHPRHRLARRADAVGQLLVRGPPEGDAAVLQARVLPPGQCRG